MVYPRALALAEVVWTPVDQKNYNGFLKRLQGNLQHLSALEVNYARHVFDVQGTAQASAGRLLVTLHSEDQSAEIRYTLDRSQPVISSPKYENRLSIDSPVTVTAARFKNGQLVGNVFEQVYFA